MGSLAQNMAKGTLLAGKGVSAGAGWVVLTVVVVMITQMASIVMGPLAFLIPLVYLVWAGDYAKNKVANALREVAEGGA